ncbi:transcription termination/antitermination protein NusG [Leisingera sp. ANG-Vp]|uniref:transcription termination/antitermination protein NusG n=1 Tax=Leisingera sp. ANG-Vp TaxID=1577896 RepID=UPI00057CE78A|nr:hypothetical protein [Leisingera sp. ANG-Vp]KIC22495.1 hypothetical protein RA20_01030 [Leisingera sp. ANG-Vp]
MTWYLGITTTKKVTLPRHLHFEVEADGEKEMVTQERGEFAVERQLRALGIEAFAPRKIEFKRQGKKRHAEPVTSAYLPGYIFAEIPPEVFAQAIQCRGLKPSLMMVSGQEVRKHVQPFFAKVAEENAEAQRIIDSRDRAAMCQFRPGAALEVLAGPFMGRILSFTGMVQEAGDMHPMIEANTGMFGQSVRVKIDPIDVKGAA